MEEETNRASGGWTLGDSCRTQRGLSTITARPVDNQRPFRMKRRSERRRRKCRRLTDEAEGCRSSLKTTRRHRERPDVGPHHICLDRKASPTTTKRSLLTQEVAQGCANKARRQCHLLDAMDFTVPTSTRRHKNGQGRKSANAHHRWPFLVR